MFENIVTWLKVAGGVACSVCTYLFGGMDAVFIALLILIALDYVSGVLVAVVDNSLSSEIGFHGLVRKVAVLILVALAHMVGQAVGYPEVRSFVIGFYLANEGLSILENAGNLGVPLPQKLVDVLKQLKDKNEPDGNENK